ncbi:vesicle-associated membrane protein 722-like [Juglans microcarpa x Juglans regia]|uniref:vesicle-associated membrane protein 722-like n=1 Tax=Juglans microcarpa x Juglans regia TaxID=2249226 RepID=UPI001B7F4DDB|nr:vesicle-associated membrane protein 722-like [Juglans microcarpa x Juglans regia]
MALFSCACVVIFFFFCASEPYTHTAETSSGVATSDGFYSPEFRGDFGAGLLDLHAMDDTELLSEECFVESVALRTKIENHGMDIVLVAQRRQIPIAFCKRIKEDFTQRHGGGKAATTVANSLNKILLPKFKEQMQYCVDHPKEISNLAKVKAQVSEVKGVMMENIEKVLDRGEKIELLVDETENLHSQVSDFVLLIFLFLHVF